MAPTTKAIGPPVQPTVAQPTPMLVSFPLDSLSAAASPCAPALGYDWTSEDEDDEPSTPDGRTSAPRLDKSKGRATLEDTFAVSYPHLEPSETWGYESGRTAPEWLRTTSGAVTAIASTSSFASDRRRVVLGTQGGELLVLRSTSSVRAAPPPEAQSSTAASSPTSRRPHRLSITSRPNLGPRRPSLASHHRRHSSTSLRSPPLHGAFSLPNSPPERSRKASATVSVSGLEAIAATGPSGGGSGPSSGSTTGDRDDSPRLLAVGATGSRETLAKTWEEPTLDDSGGSRDVSSAPSPTVEAQPERPASDAAEDGRLRLLCRVSLQTTRSAISKIVLVDGHAVLEDDFALVLTASGLLARLDIADGHVRDRLELQSRLDASGLGGKAASPVPLPRWTVLVRAVIEGADCITAASDTGDEVTVRLQDFEVLTVARGGSDRVASLALSSEAGRSRLAVGCESRVLSMRPVGDVDGQTIELGLLPLEGESVLGLRSLRPGLHLAFSERAVLLFALHGDASEPLARLSCDNAVRDVVALSQSTFAIVSRRSIQRFETVSHASPDDLDLRLTGTIDIEAGIEACCLSSFATFLIATEATNSSARSLHLRGFGGADASTVLFAPMQANASSAVSAAVSLPDGRVVIGHHSGDVTISSLDAASSATVASLGGPITALVKLRADDRGDILAIGSAHGHVALAQPDGTLMGQWQLFATPATQIDLVTGTGGRLDGSVCAASANGTVAFLPLSSSGLTEPLTIVGARAPLESAWLRHDELLLFYQSGQARLWDVASGQLRRSMSRPTALELLHDGEAWYCLAASTLSQSTSALSFDLRQTIVDATRSAVRKPADQGDTLATSDGSAALSIVRWLLGRLYTPDLNAAIDEHCRGRLGITLDRQLVAKPISLAASAAVSYEADSPWTSSPRATAERLLALIALLRVFLNYADAERAATDAIAFFSSDLEDRIDSFERPLLDVFAGAWADPTPDIQHAARLLLGSAIAARSGRGLARDAERRHRILTRDTHLDATERATHLPILGTIATAHYKLLSTSVLRDIARWVAAALTDFNAPTGQLVAVELCSNGFSLIGIYVDVASLIESLFALATGLDERTSAELRSAARTAAIHVASLNTPLFVSTLAKSIVGAKTAHRRNATLRFCALLIRKKPLMLTPALPRLVESVVRSLEPAAGAIREAVGQTVALVLVELVRTYPFVDVHDGIQRLVLGTAEGACVVFDLKTGTRLYVLDAHRAAVTACAFSPDGRRLVSASLGESRVVVYKVGSSVLSMLRPGAPPRQGTASGEPYKTLPVFHGDDLSRASELELVQFDWPAPRSARLRIRETALTFETT